MARVPKLWLVKSTMNKKIKKMTSALSALGVFVLLGGCAHASANAGGDWQWTPPARLAAGNSGSSGAVIASPLQVDAQYYVYADGQAPESNRRDESLNIVTNDKYAGFLGYAEQPRTSIDDYRSYYISTSPNQYIYPSNRRYRRDYRRPYSGYRPARRPGHYGSRRY